MNISKRCALLFFASFIPIYVSIVGYQSIKITDQGYIKEILSLIKADAYNESKVISSCPAEYPASEGLLDIFKSVTFEHITYATKDTYEGETFGLMMLAAIKETPQSPVIHISISVNLKHDKCVNYTLGKVVHGP